MWLHVCVCVWVYSGYIILFLWDKERHTTSNKSNFVSHLKQICSECNIQSCYDNNTKIDISHVKQNLFENLSTKWSTSCTNMSKLDLYNEIKQTFEPEKFLTLNIDRYEKSLLAQLRYGILPLRIETGRFVNEARCDRVCKLCNSGDIEDQIHFLFYCNFYNDLRQELNFKAKNMINDWDNLSDIVKLSVLFKDLTRVLGRFVKSIFLKRRNELYR